MMWLPSAGCLDGMEILRCGIDANCGANDSDGIARVHGMANVQAEELVEYVKPALNSGSDPWS